MKGFEDPVYVIAIIFTFILGISAMYIFFIESQNRTDETNMIRNDSRNLELVKYYFGISDIVFEKITKNDKLEGSFELISVLNESKEIILKNSGDIPLSNFLLSIYGREEKPLISPDLLLPDSYGILLLDNATWQGFISEKVVKIKARQGARLILVR